MIVTGETHVGHWRGHGLSVEKPIGQPRVFVTGETRVFANGQVFVSEIASVCHQRS